MVYKQFYKLIVLKCVLAVPVHNHQWSIRPFHKM